MTHRHLKNIICLAVTGAVAVCCTGWLMADPPTPAKVSAFAPIDDLKGQVDYYLKRLQATLAGSDGYSPAKQARAKKDANTLVVLLLAAGMHDQQSPLSKAAPALVPVARRLAASTADQQQAQACLEELSQLSDRGDGSGQPLKWEKVASLEQLMKQVPTINNRLRRSLRKDQFEKQADDSAGYSAVLAVIAQASLADTSEAKDPADTAKWFQYCADMRDAAGEVNSAVHAQDFDAATAAMARLSKSCDDCHAVFRKEEM